VAFRSPSFFCSSESHYVIISNTATKDVISNLDTLIHHHKRESALSSKDNSINGSQIVILEILSANGFLSYMI
jgi:hypothetical protein